MSRNTQRSQLRSQNSIIEDGLNQSQSNLSRVPPKQQFVPSSMSNLDIKLKHERQLLDNFKIMDTNNKKFNYIPLDTDILKSAFTNQNSQFQACLGMIESYNQDIRDCLAEKKDIINGPWKNSFYGTLQNLLLEIRFTKNRPLQAAFIGKVEEWANHQLEKSNTKKIHNKELDIYGANLNLKSLRTKRSATGHSQNSQINNTTLTTQLPDTTQYLDDTQIQEQQHLRNQSADISQKYDNILADLNKNKKQNKRYGFKELIPSEQIKDTLRDYKNKFRTAHSDQDPPNEKLRTFRHKKFLGPQQTLPEIDPLTIKGQITYPQPENYLPPQEEPAPQIKQNEEDEGDEDIIQGIDGATELKVKVAPVEISTVPNQKNYLKDSNATGDFQHELQKEFEARSHYVNYKPTDSLAEQRMEKKWQEERNKEVAEKRSEEEMVNILNNFAVNKARMEKEINRKQESHKFGNDYKECEYRPKEYTIEEKQELEHEVKMSMEEEKAIEDEEQRLKEEQEELEQQQLEQGNQTNSSARNNIQDKKLQSQPSKIVNLEKQNSNSQSGLRPTRQIKSFSLHGPRDRYNQGKMVDQSGFLPQIAKKEFDVKQPTVHGLENEMNQLNIRKTRAEYGSLIGLTASGKPKKEQDEEGANESSSEEVQKVVCQPSLSVYSRPIKKTYRPFSAVFDVIDRQSVRHEQLKEIQDIKNRMAKYKINVSIKKLMDSMVIPENFIGQKAELMPEPGNQLMPNILEEVSKKKKGGAKKKKK